MGDFGPNWPHAIHTTWGCASAPLIVIVVDQTNLAFCHLFCSLQWKLTTCFYWISHVYTSLTLLIKFLPRPDQYTQRLLCAAKYGKNYWKCQKDLQTPSFRHLIDPVALLAKFYCICKNSKLAVLSHRSSSFSVSGQSNKASFPNFTRLARGTMCLSWTPSSTKALQTGRIRLKNSASRV